MASGIEPALGMMIERKWTSWPRPEPFRDSRVGACGRRILPRPLHLANHQGRRGGRRRGRDADDRSTAAIAQFDPTAPKRVKWDVALQVLADAQGLPSKVLRSDDEIRDIEEQDAQAMQTQQLLQAVPVAAQSAKVPRRGAGVVHQP